LLLCNIDFRLLDAEKNNASIILRSAVLYSFQTIKSATCHGSTILLADILGQLNHAQEVGQL